MSARFDGMLRPSPIGPAAREALLPVVHPADSHAANLLELPGGDLLCAWFNGPGEGDPATNIVLSRLVSATDRWTAPVVVAADPERSEQNPVLFRDDSGLVWLFHTSSRPHDQRTATVRCRLSVDGGCTWAPSRQLFDQPGTFLRSPPVTLRDGSWLLPVYWCSADGDRSAVQVTRDRGESWQVHEVPHSWGRVQMTVAPLSSGGLLALFRSRQADWVYWSESSDLGQSWTAPRRTGLPNNNSSIQLTALADGSLVVAYNDATPARDQVRWVKEAGELIAKPARTPLTLAMSDDDGRSWAWARNLQVSDAEYAETPAGYSYPSVLQATDGRLHVAYSYLRKTIKHVVLDGAWVRGALPLVPPIFGTRRPP